MFGWTVLRWHLLPCYFTNVLCNTKDVIETPASSFHMIQTPDDCLKMFSWSLIIMKPLIKDTRSSLKSMSIMPLSHSFQWIIISQPICTLWDEEKMSTWAIFYKKLYMWKFSRKWKARYLRICVRLCEIILKAVGLMRAAHAHNTLHLHLHLCI